MTSKLSGYYFKKYKNKENKLINAFKDQFQEEDK